MSPNDRLDPFVSTSRASIGPDVLILASQTFTSAPPETVFIFSGDVLAESHPVTLSFTSSTCTQNPIVSITASITSLPVLYVDRYGTTSSLSDQRGMVLASGTRSKTYSAEGTGGWGSAIYGSGLVFTFSEDYVRNRPTTESPWASATAMWINPIPTTLPRFVVDGNRTVQFGGTVSFGSEIVSVTTDKHGSGWLVAGQTSRTVPGWPQITKGPVLGSDLGGASPDDLVPGGAALIEGKHCCYVCQNSSQAVVTSTKTGGGGSRWKVRWDNRLVLSITLLFWITWD
ncbi:hypothetical protein VTL71DRAFT_3550 [Oculimacula yallundae]|uniref:Uncharacterized protein n=1 Tax=Oculimacula yallundae TaxID=86028 RepID=A0ABR4C7G9_9HELO